MAKQHLHNFFRYRFLLSEIVRKNVKLQYRSSVLGALWTFLQPLLMTLVLTVIFGYIFGRNEKEVICFPIYLLSGRLLFEFFTQSTKRAMRSVRGSAGIIKKVYVPKYIYPLGNVLSTFVTFVISLTVLIAFLFYFIVIKDKPIHITPYILFSVVPVGILLILSTGVGMILAVLEVFFKDIEYIYDVFCTLLFYMTPMFYTLNSVFPATKELTSAQEVFLVIIKANPLYSIVSMFRDSILFGRHWEWIHLYYALGFSLIMLVFGVFLFYKKQDKFILHI